MAEYRSAIDHVTGLEPAPPRGRNARLHLRGDAAWPACPFHLDEEADAVQRLLDRYRELPMSLADACLVRMAALYDGSPVLTLDQDFSVYRKNGRQVISLITP